MSATRTFARLQGGGTAGAVIVGDYLKATTGNLNVEQIRHSTDQAIYLGLKGSLGGSETTGIITGAATWAPVSGVIPYTINGDGYGGLTKQIIVYYRTTNTATAVQMRLRNLTDSSNAVAGTLYSTDTALQTETLTVTLASGAKVYRLEILGDASNPVIGWGRWNVEVVPV
jgi:hypothetical protein